MLVVSHRFIFSVTLAIGFLAITVAVELFADKGFVLEDMFVYPVLLLTVFVLCRATQINLTFTRVQQHTPPRGLHIAAPRGGA